MDLTVTGRAWVMLVLVFGSAACAGQRGLGGGASLPPEYAALPDTTVCVVDRTDQRGLREVPAKVGANGIMLLVGGEMRPLEEAHPVNIIAGYAGREPWLTRGDPITFQSRSFIRTGGERRIVLDLIRRTGEHQGVLLYASEEAPSPADVIYVPTAPGCIFQAYVREDLVLR